MTPNPTHITAPAGTPFIEVVREFDAPRDLVYRASTDPDLVVRWLGPRRLTMRIIEFDARTGGSYRYVHTDTDGEQYPFRGVFHTVSEALIIQTFEFEDIPGAVSLETRILDDLGDRTRLRQNAVFPASRPATRPWRARCHTASPSPWTASANSSAHAAASADPGEPPRTAEPTQA